jgi:hypothetical protein
MTVRPGMGKQYTYSVNKYGKIVFENIDDEAEGYNACIDLVLSQPRYVLDNLNNLMEFKVSWLNYSSKDYAKKTGRNYATSHPREINL